MLLIHQWHICSYSSLSALGGHRFNQEKKLSSAELSCCIQLISAVNSAILLRLASIRPQGGAIYLPSQFLAHLSTMSHMHCSPRNKRPVQSYWEPIQALKSMMISVCDFLLAGWTQPLSAFHTTCSSHHRTLCSLFDSILPQSPTWHLLEYLLVFVVWNSCFCFFLDWWLTMLRDTTFGMFSWQMCVCVCDDSLILVPPCMISLLTVLTTSPLAIWWTTPACSAGSLWCQQVPWDWRAR